MVCSVCVRAGNTQAELEMNGGLTEEDIRTLELRHKACKGNCDCQHRVIKVASGWD